MLRTRPSSRRPRPAGTACDARRTSSCKQNNRPEKSRDERSFRRALRSSARRYFTTVLPDRFDSGRGGRGTDGRAGRTRPYGLHSLVVQTQWPSQVVVVRSRRPYYIRVYVYITKKTRKTKSFVCRVVRAHTEKARRDYIILRPRTSFPRGRRSSYVGTRSAYTDGRPDENPCLRVRLRTRTACGTRHAL